mmetsp:Transcript_22014/g.61241  ORF Transcript_22014/g.61241 Transcript_22014/m.61241 type:complete len:368 (+) Transcript_22014:434-1537(+)
MSCHAIPPPGAVLYCTVLHCTAPHCTALLVPLFRDGLQDPFQGPVARVRILAVAGKGRHESFWVGFGEARNDRRGRPRQVGPGAGRGQFQVVVVVAEQHCVVAAEAGRKVFRCGRLGVAFNIAVVFVGAVVGAVAAAVAKPLPSQVESGSLLAAGRGIKIDASQVDAAGNGRMLVFAFALALVFGLVLPEQPPEALTKGLRGEALPGFQGLLLLADPDACRVPLVVGNDAVDLREVADKVPEGSLPLNGRYRGEIPRGCRSRWFLFRSGEGRGHDALPLEILADPEGTKGIVVVVAVAVAVVVVRKIFLRPYPNHIVGFVSVFFSVFIFVLHQTKDPPPVFAAIGIGLGQVGKPLEEGAGPHSRHHH